MLRTISGRAAAAAVAPNEPSLGAKFRGAGRRELDVAALSRSGAALAAHLEIAISGSSIISRLEALFNIHVRTISVLLALIHAGGRSQHARRLACLAWRIAARTCSDRCGQPTGHQRPRIRRGTALASQAVLAHHCRPDARSSRAGPMPPRRRHATRACRARLASAVAFEGVRGD